MDIGGCVQQEGKPIKASLGEGRKWDDIPKNFNNTEGIGV